MPKISVIIPVYNVEKYLSECLDSVLAQTFTDIEIICINDGSTDNSSNILNEYAKKDARIKIINQKNSGVIVARNNAIALSSADLIYPLDSDDIISPYTLEKLYKAFIKRHGDVITSRIMCFGAQNGEMVLPKPNKLNFWRVNCSVNAALFRKSDFIKAGGYDSAYNIALEDYDLWLNFVYRQNLKFYRVPEILFFYRIKKKSESRNWQHRKEHENIQNTFYKKYPQICKYKFIYKCGMIPLKLLHFVFRIEHNTVKVFKIGLWKIKGGDK